MNHLKISVIAVLMLFLGCEKPTEKVCNGSLNGTVNTNYPSVNAPRLEGVFILNEGGFTYGNASLSFYNEQNGEIVNNVFQLVNNFALGDVCHSIYSTVNEAFVVVNNSQKIEVIDLETFERKRTISGLVSPRYVFPITDSTLLVSDFLSNELVLINHYTACIEQTIPVNGWTEEILKIGSKYYVLERTPTGVANEFANLIVFDANLNIVNRIELPIESQDMVVDENNNIWVLSAGSEINNVLPTLICVDVSSEEVIKTLAFPNWTNAPLNLVSDYVGAKLYYSKGSDIYELNIDDDTLPISAYFVTTAQNIYALSIPTSSNNIYVSDAKNYVQNGQILVYSSQGVLLNNMEVGVIPSKVESAP